jgi:hypothetical protein
MRMRCKTVVTGCTAFGVVLAGVVLLIVAARSASLYDANLHMRYLLLALRQYASEYGNGQLPPESGVRGLLALHTFGLLPQDDTRLVLDPRRLSGVGWPKLSEADAAYWYTGGYSLSDCSDSIVLVQKKGGDWGYVGYLDGRVLHESGERWTTIRSSVPGTTK